jgi:hypothetical protein
MAALVAAIHVLRARSEDVGGRDEPSHDEPKRLDQIGIRSGPVARRG